MLEFTTLYCNVPIAKVFLLTGNDSGKIVTVFQKTFFSFINLFAYEEVPCDEGLEWADDNSDGYLSLEEFLAFNGATEEMFTGADLDGDGLLSEEELCSGNFTIFID